MLIDCRRAKAKVFSKPTTIKSLFNCMLNIPNTYKCLWQILVLVLFLGSNSRGTKTEEGSSAAGDWVLQGTKVWLDSIDFVTIYILI